MNAKTKLLFIGVVFIIGISSLRAETQISMAKAFGCSMDHKIEIKDIISQCKCHDDSSCVWTTGRRPVMGCPCPVRPPEDTDYDSIITAEIVKCSEKKIEIDKSFGQCECEGGGQCIFAKRKTIAGCPCPGGRLPTESDFVQIKPVSHSKNKKNKNKKKKEQEEL
ncbi:transmembrane protein, putative (macronuclear) [Tetrahymena thermophila SB210]|uniref:Transmembrane protein, putative n=1 Tax=Tetrahymena thermophila (strain SB210) TaxID=312017 RepID=I7M2K6_TETTS|nr:transmembrane protein, putative [Tetrahymena thermophila SB210]EAS00637.1 transmembrane protein, putative [Tetrahymena thermophila SB210]|eukprot:XP_001020882.1 transmembrane protein, putative [Tetrahymena thermophila SB210]